MHHFGVGVDILTLSLSCPVPLQRNEDRGFMKEMELSCKLKLVTSNPALAVPGADIIWFAGVPIHHNPSLLRLIKPHLDPAHHVFIGTICCYGGFHWIVKRELGHGNYTPFGIQTIPWCCGTKEYGREGVIYGAKRFVRLATEGGVDKHNLKRTLMPILRQRVDDTSFLVAVLWPNNSHFHPPILYGLFKEWDGKSAFDKGHLPTYIYLEMTDSSADSVQKFDTEVCKIIEALRLKFAYDPFLKLDYTLKACIEENFGDLIADKTDIASVIRTNVAYAKHTVPYTSVGEGKVIPTVKHNFFETDVAFGLCLYRDIAQMVGIETPFIDESILWNQKLIDKVREIGLGLMRAYSKPP